MLDRGTRGKRSLQAWENSTFIPISIDEVLYKAIKAINIDFSEIAHSPME
jgi:hypothetical protein